MRFLLWNIAKHNLEKLVAELVADYQADVVFLIEPPTKLDGILRELQQVDEAFFSVPTLINRHLGIFSRTEAVDNSAVLTANSERFEFRKIAIGGKEFLFVLGHGMDRRNSKEVDRHIASIRLMENLRKTEKKHCLSHTVIAGDLNVDPYELAMIAPNGFHATMDKKMALKGARTVQREQWDLFYSPMWSFFGDRSDGPPGTYFYPPNSATSTGWHILDHVLIKGSIANWLNQIEVLSETPTEKLSTVTTGRPKKDDISDHFPIFFSIKEPSEKHE